MKIPEEITGDCIGNRKTCSFSSNWTIVSGSFDNSVNFECSGSPIDADGVDFVKKAPLVLKPSESDSSPCEITLSLMQKHEIRQVYVRSTSRIYEIYYKPDVHSSNEYLCTVRCSIASREDDPLHESNHGEGSIEPTKESDRDYKEMKSPSSANEDDWVEVKPESPVEVINSFPETIIGDERSLQDFYEATAEISDGEPSVTLIIRLLSLENKGHVYVDELYVYADAVESTALENHAAQNLQGGSLAGSSLMTMFLPTLLQLTKSNVGQSQDGVISNKVFEEERAVEGTKNNDSTSYLNEHDERSKVPARQDAEFQEVKEVTAQATPQFQKSAPVLENAGQYHSVVDCNNQVGRVMEQLISRMSRIEDICLRFEEKMVLPISSMEERLQRVENQLETIVKNTQTSELHSCARFSAPAFSSLDSTSSSFYNDGCANPPYVQSEVEKHEPPCEDISKSIEENRKSETAPQFIVSYVVTAPEFSCDEDDEQNDAVEPLKDSLSEKPKKPMSIDDALAAALSGFSSLTISEPLKPSERFTKSTNEERDTNEDSVDRALDFINEEIAGEDHLKYTQGLKFTAPDFASEDTSYDDKVLTPKIEDVNLVHSSRTFATDGGENTLDITSAPSNCSALEKEETVIVRKDNVSEQFCEGQSDADTFVGANNSPSVRAKNDYRATGETSMRESCSSKDKLSILDRFEIVKQVLAKTKDGVGTAEKISGPISKCDEGVEIVKQLLAKTKDSGATAEKKSGPIPICNERVENVKQLLAMTKDGVGTAEKISGPIINCNERGSGNDISLDRVKDGYWATGETGMLESSSNKDKLSILDRFEIVKHLLANTKDGVGTGKKTSCPISKCDERGSGNDISPFLDFGTPILEVKFTSQEDTSSVMPLEALLTDPEAESQISFIRALLTDPEADSQKAFVQALLTDPDADSQEAFVQALLTDPEADSQEAFVQALLTDPESDSQISFSQRSNDDEITAKETDLVSVVNEEKMTTSESNSFLLADLESYDAPVSSEDAVGQQVPLDDKEHEVFSCLI